MWHPNWFVALLEFWIVRGNVKESRNCLIFKLEWGKKIIIENNSWLCTLYSATSQFWALSRDFVRQPGQRSLRCKRTLTGDRQDVGKSSLLAPLLQSFGNYQTSSSVTSAVDQHQEKNISWERSWNRSEAKLDKLYWIVNRGKSVRGKMHRGVANLLGPILGVSKELFQRLFNNSFKIFRINNQSGTLFQ